jgi:hypothetical protein
MRKLVIRSGTGRPVRDTPQVLPPESRQQTVVVHHYHHAQNQTQSSGGGSLAFWLIISLLFPCVGFIVGFAFLFMPDRRGHGALLLGLSTLFALITYMVLSVLNCIPRI